MKHRVSVAIALVSAAALTLSSCGDGAGGSEDGLTVVASTSAWASVVSAVAGDGVSVTTVIDDPAADPHGYESTAEDALKFRKADLAVVNGGGYDSFAEGLAEQAPDVPVIDAFALFSAGTEGHEHGEDEHAEGHEHGEDEHAEGHEHAEDEHGHDHGGVNEHVWYDLHTVHEVAEQVAQRLGKLAPEQATEFEANAKAFGKGLDALDKRLVALGAEGGGGTKVLATEPVAFYLLKAANLHDVTPPAFSKAIEGDTDVPVAAQAEVSRLVDGGTVVAVVNNPQTETKTTRQLVAAAEKAGVPVVQVSETPPAEEQDYLEWAGDAVSGLEAAVAPS